MSNMVECHKCQGAGEIAHYRNIDNGVCYACEGTGKVKALRGRTTRTSNESASCAPGVKAAKRIELGKLGSVLIERWTDAGGYTVRTDTDKGAARSVFLIEDGKVIVTGVCNLHRAALTRYGRGDVELAELLQAALRV